MFEIVMDLRLGFFLLGGGEIASSDGTTQGNPFAMPTYAIGIVPLLPLLKSGRGECNEKLRSGDLKHVAYADDLAGAGKLHDLRIWWSRVESFGPLLGYYPKASKSLSNNCKGRFPKYRNKNHNFWA